MQKFELSVKLRKEEETPDILREQNFIPAVIYGQEIENKNLKIDRVQFEKVLEEAGRSSLVLLKIEDQEPVETLIQDVQFDPVKDNILHADFKQIKRGEKLRVEVELKFVGESKAVKELGGILVKSIDSVEIECLPKDLVHEIEVDISSLDTFEDAIKIKDIKVGEETKILENPEETVATVTEIEEEKEVEEKPVEEVGEVEVAGKEKEGEEGKAEAGEKVGEEKSEAETK